MQIYKNLAKNLFANKKNNFADFAQTTNTLEFVEQLQPKTYYETYKELYFGAKCFAVLAQIATAISSYSFYAVLFTAKITNEYAQMFCVCAVLIFIETIKYLLLNKALLSIFSLPAKPNYVLLVLGLILSFCSIYASIVGGGNLGIDTAKVETVKSEFDSEIAFLRTEITDIQKRNTYKGNTYISGKDKKLLHQKETTLQGLQAKKDSELAKVHDLNETNANTFKIGFGLFDILFLLCTFYIWYFSKCVAIESLASDLLITIPIDNKIIDSENKNVGSQDVPNTQQNAIPNQQNKIGFQYDFTHLKNKSAADAQPNLDVKSENDVTHDVNTNAINGKNDVTHDVKTSAINNKVILGNGNRICLHCQGIFTYKVHNHKYCGEDCRIAAWELRTGKIFTKPKTK